MSVVLVFAVLLLSAWALVICLVSLAIVDTSFADWYHSSRGTVAPLANRIVTAACVLVGWIAVFVLGYLLP